MGVLTGYIDPLRPYFTLAKYVLIAVVLGGAVLFGRSCGISAGEDKRVAQVRAFDAQIGKKNAALAASATALRQSADTFRTISEQTKRNAAESERVQNAAKESVMGAKDDARKAKARVDELERRLREETNGCDDGRRQVCGMPLQ